MSIDSVSRDVVWRCPRCEDIVIGWEPCPCGEAVPPSCDGSHVVGETHSDCPQHPKPERQHITDAAWRRLVTNSPNMHRNVCEAVNRRDGVVFVTVEEWDKPRQVIRGLTALLGARNDSVRLLLAELEKLRKVVRQNAKTVGPDPGSNAVTGAAHRQNAERDTSWPPPAHRARYIPFL